ncbi:hypothetical protein [Paracidovorax anthurii]|uniref:Uncharacterized protein n=1 Tax=Paracidovorax anthurii TaxID=78229 RepID=A0A328YLB7_9BURK|nr:hypothetical protein [Paracidovorax anthurii]RAR71407.1 hypothetical protein AX018_11003 [Paracidovorax anthurii]
MHTISLGVAKNNDSGIWHVVDAAGSLLAKYDQNRFPYIESGSNVYFVLMQADPRYCANVQPRALVDDRLGRATPSDGFTDSAEMYLRSFLMDQVYTATQSSEPARSSHFADLDEKMDLIKSSAEKSKAKLKQVTTKLLKRLGIS